ncbi:hypothetical protein CC80DRAFT_557534 [Byssothecium circinans]|uniref:Uncharacterized protein n=1 Tax=Byssothecium circinans TaxID=147558 RepID=A0A6A5UFI5_9PLEO|nr:hypothetical protein CC80DRAFT_557534 [Byssothecium circinans]
MVEFSINLLNVSYFVLNNASNNNAAVRELVQEMGFNAPYHRFHYGPHTLNLIS